MKLKEFDSQSPTGNKHCEEVEMGGGAPTQKPPRAAVCVPRAELGGGDEQASEGCGQRLHGWLFQVLWRPRIERMRLFLPF